MMKLLCIGDSNTYGYDPRSYFGDRYPAEIRWTDNLDGREVSNCGMNGLAVPTDVKPWMHLIESRHPDLIMVMLGSNDLLEGRSAESTSNRMEVFLTGILHSVKHVLLVAPPRMKPGTWVQNEKQIEESCKLGTLYRKVSERLGTDFADAGEWSIDLTFDGVHFTESGHKAFAAALNKHLEEKYHE